VAGGWLQRKLQRAVGREVVDERLDRQRADVEHVWTLLDEHQVRISRLEGQARRVDADLARAWQLFEQHDDRIARVERAVRIGAVMSWIEQATLTRRPLISVVLPTWQRPQLVGRAVESVLAQDYPHWELLVCEDGSTAETAAAVAAVADHRVRYLPAEQAGSAVARNRGLAEASGELIAYLDDDNRMHRSWLKSVAWAFEQRPEVEVLYGGIIIDDTARHHAEAGAEMPSVWLEPYRRAAVLEANVADTSAIAHRASLSTRWDEELVTLGDWDFLLRATAEREPLTLPVVACYYHTDAPVRLTDRRVQQRDVDHPRIVSRARAVPPS
jgi:hypothetical protein